MTEEQLFSNFDLFLNPQLNYEGEFLFHANTLLASQKGDSLKKYFETIYYAPLRTALKSAYIPEDKFNFIFTNSPTPDGRVTHLKSYLFIDQYAIHYLGIHTPDSDSMTTDEAITWLRDEIRKFRKQINLYLQGEAELPEFLRSSLELNLKFNPRFKETDFFDAYNSLLTNLSVGLRYIAPILDKPLDLKEIASRVNIDKCMLSLAKASLENANLTVATFGKLHNTFSQCASYNAFMTDVKKKNPGYRIKTNASDMFGNITYGYSLDTYMHEVAEVTKNHPEFKVIQIVPPQGENYRNYDKAMELVSRYADAEKVKALSGSWEFIPKGVQATTPSVIDGKAPVRVPKPNNNNGGLADYTDEDYIYSAQLRENYLNGTAYLYNLKGKNNFEGYIGYIYQNGIVIFEKLYESIDPLIPARSNATYIMSINNFVEMSRRTKADIIEYIKSGASDVRRVYHSRVPGKWETKINGAITGRGYSNETLQVIDELLQKGLLNEESQDVSTGGRK